MLKHKNIFTRWSFWLSLLFFLYFLILIPSDLVSYGWSTNFVRLGYIGGSHWAIQFGLLLKIINIFTNLLPFSVIKNSYILASLLGAISLGLLYEILTITEGLIRVGNRKIGLLLKNVSVVLLGTSQSFFLQSHFIERYMLVFIGLEIISLLIFKISKNKNGFGGEGLFLVLIMILGVSYHWLFLWALLLILIGVLLKRPFSRNKLIFYFFGFIFIMVGGLIIGKVFSSNTNISYSYVGAKNINDSVNSYFNSYFSDGFSRSFSVNFNSFSETFFNIINKFVRLEKIFVAILALIGIRIVVEKYSKKSYLWLLFLAGVFLWPSLWFSNLNNTSEAVELYFLIIISIVGIYSFIGALLISDRLFRGLSIIHNKKAVSKLFFLVIGGVISFALLSRRSDIGTNNFEAIEIKRILSELPAESLLLCFDDLICADLIYFSRIESVGEDIKIIPYDYQSDSYNLDLSDYQPFGYKEQPYILHELISVALSGGDNRVFSVGMTSDYYRFLGFNLGFVHYLPLGNYGEVMLVTPNEWPTYDYLTSDGSKLSNKSLLENKFLNLMIENRILNSNISFQSGNYIQGYKEMNAASRVASKLSEDDFSRFLTLRNNAEQYKKNPLFVNSDKKESIDQVYDEIPLYIDGGYYSRAADLVRGIIMLDPLNKEVRNMAAEVYQKINQKELADFELEISKNLD